MNPALPHVDKDMTEVRDGSKWHKSLASPSVSDWFRSAHGGLIRGNLRGFVPIVKGKVNFHFSCYTVSQLWGPSALRRATMRMHGTWEKTEPRMDPPPKPLGHLSPVLPEAALVHLHFGVT